MIARRGHPKAQILIETAYLLLLGRFNVFKQFIGVAIHRRDVPLHPLGARKRKRQAQRARPLRQRPEAENLDGVRAKIQRQRNLRAVRIHGGHHKPMYFP